MKHQYAQLPPPWGDQPFSGRDGHSRASINPEALVVSEWNTCTPQNQQRVEEPHLRFRPDAQDMSNQTDLTGVQLEDSSNAFT